MEWSLVGVVRIRVGVYLQETTHYKCNKENGWYCIFYNIMDVIMSLMSKAGSGYEG